MLETIVQQVLCPISLLSAAKFVPHSSQPSNYYIEIRQNLWLEHHLVESFQINLYFSLITHIIPYITFPRNQGLLFSQ